MELRAARDSDVDNWKEVILIYSSALKMISTRLEILNDEFHHVHQYNPIEHIKARLKSPESIVKKLKKHGSSVQNGLLLTPIPMTSFLSSLGNLLMPVSNG